MQLSNTQTTHSPRTMAFRCAASMCEVFFIFFFCMSFAHIYIEWIAFGIVLSKKEKETIFFAKWILQRLGSGQAITWKLLVAFKIHELWILSFCFFFFEGAVFLFATHIFHSSLKWIKEVKHLPCHKICMQNVVSVSFIDGSTHHFAQRDHNIYKWDILNIFPNGFFTSRYCEIVQDFGIGFAYWFSTSIISGRFVPIKWKYQWRWWWWWWNRGDRWTKKIRALWCVPHIKIHLTDKC